MTKGLVASAPHTTGMSDDEDGGAAAPYSGDMLSDASAVAVAKRILELDTLVKPLEKELKALLPAMRHYLTEKKLALAVVHAPNGQLQL